MPPETANTTTETVVTDKSMADGVLEGGWGYIGAAYGITWAGLLLYTAYLVIRRTIQRSAAREQAT